MRGFQAITSASLAATALAGLASARLERVRSSSPAPPTYGSGSNITCSSQPLDISNPIWVNGNDNWDIKTYIGIQDQGEDNAATLKYAQYVQPPTPFAFYECKSTFMPNTDANGSAGQRYGHLRYANTQSEPSCFTIGSLENSTDQKLLLRECTYAEGAAQLGQWFRYRQSDDNVQIEFVGVPDTKYNDGTYGSYSNVNLTVPTRASSQGTKASYWGLHWTNSSKVDNKATVYFEYNRS